MIGRVNVSGGATVRVSADPSAGEMAPPGIDLPRMTPGKTLHWSALSPKHRERRAVQRHDAKPASWMPWGALRHGPNESARDGPIPLVPKLAS